MLELLSYNIFNGRHLGKILGWIKQSKPGPDIFCFQEFPENKIDQVKEQLKDTSYAFEFAPAFAKKRVRYGELTAYKKDILKMLDSEIVELGAGKFDRVIYRRGAPKTSLITKFKYGSKTFSVANVHLIVIALHTSRKKQLAKIIEQVDKNCSALIVGDYNYSVLFGRKRGLVQFMGDFGYQMAGNKQTTHRLFLRKFPQQIDYAFYRDMKIAEAKVGRVKFSDHFPILVKFSV